MKEIVPMDPQRSDFGEAEFKFLMQRRINKVLIICSNYDFFMLEEDGRIDEQIFNEYVSLNLRYPPVFILANTARKAFDYLEREHIDLVISMLSVGEMDPFELSKRIKTEYPHIPIVVLTHFSREVSIKLEKEDLSAIDYVFSWLGNADLLLAIIKLIEDRMNLNYDVNEVGAQVIILVEDSIRYYSSFLPAIYKIVFKQSKSFMQEGLNEHRKMLRMRGRPKILLATNYEQAIQFFRDYKDSTLGIISDISYKREGKKDQEAGLKFCKAVREEDPYVPFLLQSSELSNQAAATDLNASFLHKYSKTLEIELRNFMLRYMNFGDFIFRDPETKEEIGRASNLKEMQDIILKIPAHSLKYHFNNNDFSKWFNARAFFQIGSHLKHKSLEFFGSVEGGRQYIFNLISSYRLSKARGVISTFDRTRFDEYMLFSRIGEGSLGGKARGLAFIDSFIKQNELGTRWDGVLVTIPRTVVISTEVFEEFMDLNNLWRIVTSRLSDEQILQSFVNATLPVRIYKDLEAFIRVIRNPIAVRSSSLLEDSHYQPFAGIYSTFMLPKIDSDKQKMIYMIADAIKSVYASVYFKSSKAYLAATQNVIDAERMAIILQEVCGNRYNNRFYPTLSGVARSINFYPIGKEKPEDGIANIAYGLGKLIVEGGTGLRFSPRYPGRILQLSSVESTLRETQREFYALDLVADHFHPSVDDGVNLLKLKVKEAEGDAALRFAASVYDMDNGMIRDHYTDSGRKVVTFNNILKHNTFPLADILHTLMQIGEKEMNNPIEMEFAVNLDAPAGTPKIFNFLQIRPVVENTDALNFKLEEVNQSDTIINSFSALGNGLIRGIRDFVYVKPECFRAADSMTIARCVEAVNERFVASGSNYVLVGPGRWGSSDHWLGIPVKWPQISAARVIVESGLPDYRIDPSQGTHFFQNLTSFRVGYLTINPFINDGFYDLEFLNRLECVAEDEYIRHIRFPAPLLIKIDGARNRGVIYKPGFGDQIAKPDMPPDL
ncbi:MAG: phosphoenolpyruvate synthase [Bacteroidetes bacterium GWF2_49_14]|nr:MAG: phosphoenolpyruvate synthase [Bacteroidetes bacterium GWF2_49_14]